ncbi:hypothetical protein H6G91_32595 [Nostoc muscorum FACHB-395]|jgi:hypothetical protein|nr:hypothetical protein [Desmonostoc muscorum FACHB-395]
MSIPGKDSYEVQWQTKELRRDMKVVLTEWLHNSSSTAEPIAHTTGVTVEWSVQAQIGFDIFESVKASLGITYSQSYTETNQYTGYIEPGRTGRMVYIPMMHHFNGWITIWEKKGQWGGECGSSSQGPNYCEVEVKEIDHNWCPLYFPISGGQYEMEYQEAICYVDSYFNGGSVALHPGQYDWGSIPNDAISSLKVPEGLRVTLFENTHFQGRSKTFPAGDYFYVGDDFNDITSSIRVERT